MKRCFGLIAVVFLTGILLSGCATEKKSENTDQGMEAISKLNYQAALDCFEKALVSKEDEELVYRGQGIAYIGMTQYEEAVKSLEKSLSFCRGNISSLEYDTNYYLAVAYYKSGDIDGALKVYDSILKLRPKEKNAYYLRGTLELEKGNFDSASMDFNQAVTLAPSDYSGLIDIYSCLKKYGYKDAGVKYLEDAMKANEKSISDFDKGRFYYYLEDYDNARNCLEKARDVGGPEAILYLGKTYEALGDYNYAASVYDNYITAGNERPELYNQLGLCKIQMKDYESALESIEKGIAVENNSFLQPLKFNEIVVYERLGQFRKAAVLMEGYLKLYPDDTRAKREYTFLKTR